MPYYLKILPCATLYYIPISMFDHLVTDTGPVTATVSLVKIKGHFYYTQNPSANISLGEVDVALERDPRF